MSRVESDEEATYRTGHAADTCDRTYGGARKHIRDSGEEVGRPTLVRTGGDAQQTDSLPFGMQAPNGEDGHNQTCAEKHGGEARARCRESELAKRCGQPASADAADSGHVIDEDERQAEVRKIQMKPRAEVRRQPEKIKPPDGISEEFCD